MLYKDHNEPDLMLGLGSAAAVHAAWTATRNHDHIAGLCRNLPPDLGEAFAAHMRQGPPDGVPLWRYIADWYAVNAPPNSPFVRAPTVPDRWSAWEVA